MTGPLIGLAAAAGAALVVLIPLNLVAVRSWLASRLLLNHRPGRRWAAASLLLSWAALLSGPLMPVLSLAVLVVGRVALSRLGPSSSRETRLPVTVATYNALTMLAFVVGLVLAIFLYPETAPQGLA